MILGDIYEASKEGNKFVGEIMFSKFDGLHVCDCPRSMLSTKKSLNPQFKTPH